MENAGYLFAAFTVIWAFVFVYVIVMLFRQKRLRQEIDRLKEGLKEKADQK